MATKKKTAAKVADSVTVEGVTIPMEAACNLRHGRGPMFQFTQFRNVLMSFTRAGIRLNRAHVEEVIAQTPASTKPQFGAWAESLREAIAEGKIPENKSKVVNFQLATLERLDQELAARGHGGIVASALVGDDDMDDLIDALG